MSDIVIHAHTVLHVFAWFYVAVNILSGIEHFHKSATQHSGKYFAWGIADCLVAFIVAWAAYYG